MTTSPAKKRDRRKKARPAAALSGDERAAVLAAHERLCWRLARDEARRTPGADLEDLAAEARLRLVKCCESFDPARGLKFMTYAFRSALRAVRRAGDLEAARGVTSPAYMGRMPHPTGSLYAPCDGGEVLAHPEAPTDDRADYGADWWDTLTRCLSPRLRAAVLLVYRDGLSQAEAAAALGVRRAAVHMRVTLALRRMRETLTRERVAG